MKAFSKRAVLGVLTACLALALVGAGCGDKFSTDKCKDLPEANVCAAAGLQRCATGGASNEVCAPNADGCLVWSPGVPCAADQACSETDGQCRCSNTCSAVGGTECSGSVIRTCTASEAGCLAWMNGEDCAASDMVCDEGSGTALCARDCTGACTPAGARRCQANMIQGCGEEASGCLGWLDLQDCAAEDASCVNPGVQPRCDENCHDDCVLAEYPQCDAVNNALLTCATQLDGCTDINSTACGALDICDPALDPPACVLDCTAACTLNATQCSADLRAVETCQAVADACNAFSQTQGCVAGEICEVAAGAASCVACTADCAGKECGPDGCGGECAPGCDPVTEVCNAAGLCENACIPACAGKNCGDDGCGATCGECADTEMCNAQQTCQAVDCVDPVQDGSFEATVAGDPPTNAYWIATGVQYNPLCSEATCGAAMAADGDWYIWMGGTSDLEENTVTQDVVIPVADFANLSFGFGISGTVTANMADYFEVTIDGTQVFLATRAQEAEYPTYTLVTIDVSAYADDADHTLVFHGYMDNVTGERTNFWLDMIWIDACTWGACADQCVAADFPACNAGNGNLDTCADTDADGCTELASTACDAGLTCQGAAGAATCMAGCVDDCVAANFPACNADAIDTCADTDADGCTELTSTPCDAGETCDASSGTPTCVPDAQRVDITVWDFEASNTTPSVGAGTASAGAGVAIPGSGEFPTGFNNVGLSWTRDGWATTTPEDVTDYFAFAVDLTGRTSILFSFDERRSNTGIREFNLAYSLDGTNFLAVPGSTTQVPDDANWRSQTFDLSALVDNQASATIRVYGYAAEGAAGTWRIDNVAFRGL